MERAFQDRVEGAREPGGAQVRFLDADPFVPALPRGGVPGGRDVRILEEARSAPAAAPSAG